MSRFGPDDWDLEEEFEPLFGVCPTCGESPGSPDAGPCDGTPDCARRQLDEHYARDEAEYRAGLEREVRLRES